MNLLVAVFWEALLHSTLFALPGIVVYLAWRRWSPAAGALAAASSLVVMALVAFLSISPWPRWGTAQPIERVRQAVASFSPERPPVATSDQLAGQTTAPGPASGARTMAPQPPAPEQPTMFFLMLQSLAREWGQPAAIDQHDPWSWRSWLAVVMLGCAALGAIRLVSGLWAIRRLSSSSTPLDDPALVDTLALICAEMSCRRPVELRTAPELATAATIGWRRPLILLPEDWRSWNMDERRAVLAHELAHVCRCDFMTGLLAQLSLASLFYHPLAHWLAARLRLEQELAADAWSARLAGGSMPYLTTLAQMALRRDDRALSWPARAFLPSRGTFIRRIEMLRHSRSVRHVWLSSRVRLLTIGLLAGIGVGIAGLRGPLAAPEARAQTTSEKQTPAGAGAPSASPAIDLAYLPSETKLFLALQPADLLGRPDMRPIQKLLADNVMLGRVLPLPLDEIDQLIVFWESSPQNQVPPGSPTLVPPPSGMIVHAAQPQDWKKIASRFMHSTEVVQVAGQTLLRPARDQAGPSSMSLYSPDDRTVVLAAEDLLRTLIEDRKEPKAAHPWDAVWNQVDKGQINFALDTRWLRRRLNQGEIKLDTLAPLLEKARAYALGISLDRELKVDAAATVNDAEDLRPVADTLQALLTMGRNAVPSLKEQAGHAGQFSEAGDWALGTLAALLSKTRIEPTGKTVRVQASAPVDLATAARLVGLAGVAAQSTASHVQSQNNLKQIGLAFHNYADINKHFPPPVLYGGKSGKVPYSWRVAILPYLDQSDLYNAYNFDEPWDGPSNSKLIDRMPSTYAYPGMGSTSKTHAAYFVFTGPQTLLGKGDKPLISDVTDGLSRTLLAVEAKREVPWTKPEDIPYDAALPLPRIGGFDPEESSILYGDGSVRSVHGTIKEAVLRALITRAGGEAIGTDIP